MKTIRYAANEWGYIVQVIQDGKVREECHVGNHKLDSCIIVPLDNNAANKPAELMQLAHQAAKDIGHIHGVEKKDIQYNSDLHVKINALDKTVHSTIKLPRCWKRLISTDFEDLIVKFGEKEVASEHNQNSNDDPLPHYDDVRTIEKTMPDGIVLCITLQSGQGNYYATAVLSDGLEGFGGECIYDSDDVIEEFYSPLELKAENGKTYIVEIEWDGEDPYE